MKYWTYLAERKLNIGVLVVTIVSVEIFLMTQKVDTWFAVFLGVIGILCALVISLVNFTREAKYIKELQQQEELLEQKYFLYEIARKGVTQEQKAFAEILYQMERSMEENVDRYRKNNKDYKDYIETWVHEIKIPIAAQRMILTNHKMEDDFGLEEELNRMEGYVEQALFYARSNDVEKDYLIRPVTLESVVHEVILSKRKMLRQKRISLDLHDLEAEVASDPKWLGFLVGQVIENSVKYMKEGAEEPGRIEISAEENDNNVVMKIRDNGIGMKSSEVGKVFEKGFTGTNGRSGRASTGIGLYLCKKLCSRLEHGITFESEENEGTTVTFIFPKSSMTAMKD